MGMYERQLFGYDGKLLTIGGKLLRLFATGLYTFDELNTMILTQDYIPVANADELDSLRNSGNRTMGAGSPWEGIYNTGIDKKYVQVQNITLIGYQEGSGFTPIGASSADPFVGVYDGNELTITNLYINLTDTTTRGTGLFEQISANSILRNIILSGEITTSRQIVGLLTGGIFSGSTGAKIINCHVSGSVTSTANGSTGGFIGFPASTAGEIENCSANVTVNGVTKTGGFAGDNAGLIKNCFAISDITVSGVIGGGFIGQNSGTITECYVITDLTMGNSIGGGFVGDALANGKIERCYATGSVFSNYSASGGFAGTSRTGGTPYFRNCYTHCTVRGSGTNTGGFIGNMRIEITNCYATGAITITGSAVSTGGLVGSLTSGSITNSYYDSQTTGRSDTGKGLPRTTAQMKYGTASSFINSDGTTDATEDPANAMYTSWDTDIWDFLTTADYPVLK